MTDKTASNGLEHNLKATLKYAELLYGQIRGQTANFRSPNILAIRDLALLCRCLVKHEVDTIQNSHVDSNFSLDQTVAVLLSAAASYFGFRLVPISNASDPDLYTVKYASSQGNEFIQRLALSSEVSVEAYLDITEQFRKGVTRLEIKSLTKTEWQDVPLKGIKKPAKLSPEEEKLLKHLDEVGVLKAFNETLTIISALKQQLPKDVGSFLLKYLFGLVIYPVSTETYEHFTKELGGQVQFLQNQGIVTVLCDGEIRRFIPKKVLVSRGASASFDLGDFHIETKTALAKWNRNRFGYVPTDQHIFLEMLLHSIGDCGRTMKDIRIRP